VTDLDALAQQLRAQASASSTITLDSTVLPGTVLDDLRTAFALPAAANLIVAGVNETEVPEPVDGTLTISAGTAAVLNQDDVPIVLTFTAGADAPDVVVLAAMSESWTFTDSFAGLTMFPFPELAPTGATFVYSTVAQDSFSWPGDQTATIAIEAGLSFLSEVTIAGFAAVTELLGDLLGVAPVKFYGTFGPVAGQSLPVGTIRAPLGSGSFTVGVPPNALSLADPALAVALSAPTDDDPLGGVDLVVEADFNQTLRVSVSIPDSGGALGIGTVPLPNESSIISLIESLPGGSEFSGYLPAELAGIFAEVGLDSFTMVVDSSPKVTFLGLSISTLAPWAVITDVLVLDGLKLRIESVDPTGTNWTQVFIDATAEFLPHIFTGTFGFSVELAKQATWEVSTVSGSYFGAVGLGDLVGGLLGDQDSVPAVLRAIQLSDFAVNATRASTGEPFDYSFAGSAMVAFPLLDTTLTAHLGLAVSRTTTGYSVQLSGSLVVGVEAFTLELDLGTAGAQLSATWASTGSPLEFADIADAFGWDMPALPDGLDLALTDAGFGYDFATGALTLFASSANYGQVTFVSEIVEGTRAYLFDLNLPLTVALSDLPVVGRQIPASVDVGIHGLELAYASAAFTEDAVTAINTALAAIGGAALGPASVAVGLMIVGTLQLGPDQQQLSLALGGSASRPAALTAGAEPAAASAPTSASGAWLNVGRTFGPLRIDRVGMQYANGTLMFALDAGIALGPLAFSIDGLSVGSELSVLAPVFGISGLGLAYQEPPLEIAGAILRVPAAQLAPDVKYQFDGMLVLKAADFSLAAIGSYAQLTSGAASLFVFAQLEAELGGPPAFFVTGLMAGFGYNRTLVIPGQDEVASFPLLLLAAPPQPGQSSTQDPTEILQVLEGSAPLNGVTKAWVTPQAGEYWLAAGLEFTSFELISTKALLVVEFGNDLTIALLGLSTMQLPQPVESPQAYAFVEMMIRVVVQPLQGYFAATAILSPNSYVITPDAHLTGGFAFYLWFGDNPNAGQFVVTLGGYHPAFAVPSYYPQVPRLGFNWAVSDVVSIKGDAYFALTTSCIMAGGGLEVQFNSGDLQAWYIAHADFLVSWHPFFYLAQISVSIGVSYRLSLLGCHKTVTASLGADMNVWGPPTGGVVRVNLVVVSFTVKFGSDGATAATEPLVWNEFQALLPAADVLCRIAVVDGLYKTQAAPANSSGNVWVVRAGQFAFQTRSAIPASRLTCGDTSIAGGPGDGIAIKPMNLTGVASTHTLKIYQGASTTPADVSGWTLASLPQAVPESLWGAPPVPFSQIPAQPSADVLTGQLGGFAVSAPTPEPGDSRGPVAQQVLLAEYLAPAGQAPLSTAVAPTVRYVPAADAQTVGLIEQVMSPAASQARAALFAALSGAGLYGGDNGDLSQLAAGAGHLFTDSPMRQN
jgi:hypothetical protein